MGRKFITKRSGIWGAILLIILECIRIFLGNGLYQLLVNYGLPENWLMILLNIISFGWLDILIFIGIFGSGGLWVYSYLKEKTEKLAEKEKQELKPDFPLWDAVLYLQNETKAGKNKHWLEIYELLKESAISHKINIWAKNSPGQKNFIRLTVSQVMDLIFDAQPIDPVGRVRWSNDVVMYAPTLSKREIKKEFI